MTSQKEYKIKYGTSTITYSIVYSNRKTLGITVTPEKQVLIRSPYNTSINKINGIIQKKLKWISNKLAYFESLPPLTPERKYISGESHFYLGKQYRLKITKSFWETVKLKGAYIQVYTMHGTNERIVKILLDNWYLEKAKYRFDDVLNSWLTKFKKYNISKPNLVIKKLKKRWGSCTVKGNIILNFDLIKTPISCINYVIVHELCHLVHRKHDKNYYKLLSLIFSDWEKRKKHLDNLYWKII